MKALCEAVRAALAQAGLLHPGARVLCAVSGGADSVALLHALSRVRAETGFALQALHVQHGLRGESSLEDEHFVRALCKELAVEAIVEKAGLEGSMDTPGMETLARDARKRLFEKHMAHADALLLAHHRDDQAETVLMHLMRGSGMSGLCGMRTCVPFGTGVMLRPFLAIPKEHILQALEGESLPHREDESNLDPVTARNIIRSSLLPQMERLYPGAGMHMAQTAQIVQTDEDFLSAEARRVFDAAFYGRPPFHMLAVRRLKDAHPAIARRVLRHAYECIACAEERSLTMADTLRLEQLVHAPAGVSLNLPASLMAVRGPEHIHFTRTGPVQSGEAPQAVCAQKPGYRFEHCFIAQEAADASSAVPASAREVILAPGILACGPVLRMPRPGDVIRPMGAAGAKPLRRFFTDRKADPFFRFQLPVLALGQEVLWTPGMCASEALRIHSAEAGSIRLTLSRLFDPHQSKE